MRPGFLRLVLGLLLLGGGLTARAEDGRLANELVTLLDGAGNHPLGLYAANYSGSQVELISAPAPALKGQLANANQKLVWNFNQHADLAAAIYPAQPDCFVRLRLTSEQDCAPELGLGWRLPAAALSSSSRLQAEFKAGEPRELVFPLPPAPADKIEGLYLQSSLPIVLTVDRGAVISLRQTRLAAVEARNFLNHDSLELSGEAAPGVNEVEVLAKAVAADGGAKLAAKRAPVAAGRFSVAFARTELKPNLRVEFAARAAGREAPASVPIELFVYPALTGQTPPRLTCREGKLLREGRTFGFVGINYTRFQMPFCRAAPDGFEIIARDVDRLAAWGMTWVRLTLNLAMVQAAEGVFPDNPQWLVEIEKRKLNAEFMAQLEYFLALCAEHGIYAVIDWHETPTNPYRYFTGGDPQAKDSGRPGTALAWLCPDPTQSAKWNLADPRHRQALLAGHAWLAGRLKDRTNVAGFEVPFNEPADAYLSCQANWSHLVAECCRAVKDAAPQLLTFANTTNYSHNTEAWAFTWLRPEGLDGYTPHHYIANGPVPIRPEAKETRQPWLCRDREKTFALSLPALFFASQVWLCPAYNGEGGEHGAGELLPELPHAEAADRMYEASLAQCYLAGINGHVNWTMFGTKADFDIYPRHGPRYAQLLRAGPLDWSHAEVAFIQNTEARPTDNGQNYACVPFVELMLALHLGPVHYLTDDYLIFNGLTRQSMGLEQVSGSAIDLASYKALIVDRRNLDQRISRLLEKAAVKILWVDELEKLSETELAEYLTAQGVAVDRKTPAGIQLGVGPEHVLVYRRAGEGGRSRIYPRVKREGEFRLIDESGQTVFTGPAAQLAEQGVEVELGRWRSLILRLE